MYTPHTHCRACGYAKPTPVPAGIKANTAGKSLIPVFDLGVQPLANDFRKDDEERAGFAPLKVMLCPVCGLAQLSVVVRPDILYSNYAYETSKSNTMLNHFERLNLLLQQESPCNSILEIGSNDGDFLAFMLKQGAKAVLGIDPAVNLAKTANAAGVATVAAPFDAETASLAKTLIAPPDVIVARHVFCHINDWQCTIANMQTLCSEQTIIAIEVPYVASLLEKTEFDTIYHEHLSYLTVQSLVALLEDTDLELYKIIRSDIHGGVLVLLVKCKSGKHSPDGSVQAALELERQHPMRDRWSRFACNAQLLILELRTTVLDLISQDATIVAYGASAKSTVLINACGFTNKEIGFICDNTPYKQYRFSPGSGIPIVDEGALLRELPTHAIMCCWNYRDEVIAKNARWIEKGGRFIMPLPRVELVP